MNPAAGKIPQAAPKPRHPGVALAKGTALCSTAAGWGVGSDPFPGNFSGFWWESVNLVWFLERMHLRRIKVGGSEHFFVFPHGNTHPK